MGREQLSENPDMLNLEGDIVGNSPVPGAHGSRNSYAIYAETRIPIFSPVTSTYSRGDGKNPQLVSETHAAIPRLLFPGVYRWGANLKSF